VLFRQTLDHCGDLAGACITFFHAAAHEAFELSDCAHLPAERTHRVLIESCFVERLWFAVGAERHGLDAQ
jgi:hypothetical protein